MIRSVTIFLLLLSFFNPAQAQYERRPVFYLSTGITIPSAPEEFSRYWNPGPNFGFGLGYPATDYIILRGNVDYQRMMHDADKERADLSNGSEVDFQGGTATIFTATAGVKVNMRPAASAIIPYLVVGAGYLRLSLTEMITTYHGQTYRRSVDPESAAAFTMGVGCDFHLANRVTLFVEGKYATGYTKVDNTQYFPIKIGIALR
jgi:opacity protein-like surface antigen